MEKLNYLKYQKIMILEDDEILLKNYTSTFENFFGDVISVNNFKDACNQFKELKPDLVVVDIHLKNDKKDGLDFIKVLREENDNTPIFVFSATTEPDVLLKAIPLHIIDYFVKPVVYSDMIIMLKTYIKELESSDSLIVKFKNEISFNFLTYELKRGDEIQKLPMNARKLLAQLIKAKENFVTYEMIENDIYFQKDFYITTVRNHISMIRSILGKESILVNVDQGYKLQL